MADPHDQDQYHLNLLSVFHYVVGGIALVAGLCPVPHLVVGSMLLGGGLPHNEGEAPPAWFGLLFTGVPALLMLFAWGLAVAAFLAGGRLKRRTGYTFCVVVGGVECLFMPLGTVLGVFTLLVLMRPSVKRLFGVEDREDVGEGRS